jgi:hypothetical protein
MPTFNGRISSMGCSWILKSVGKGYTQSSSLFRESVRGRSSSATRSITGPEAFKLSRPKCLAAGISAASPMINIGSVYEMPHAGAVENLFRMAALGVFISESVMRKLSCIHVWTFCGHLRYLVELSGRIAPFKLHFAWDGICRDDSCDLCLSSVMKMP